MLNVTRMGSHLCSKCNQTFKTMWLLRTHFCVEIEKEINYLCDKCPRWFRRNCDFVKHINSCGKSYPCTNCELIFTTIGGFHKHLSCAHNWHQEYKCDTCGKNFESQTLFRLHRTQHKKDGKFVCKVCNQTFAQAANLTKHFDNCGQVFPCFVCNRLLRTKTGFKIHMIRIHQTITIL